jgi:hypothetical protein
MTIYVDSNATGGSNTGGSWANAYLTLQQSTGAAAGENVLVADDHNQVAAGSITCNYSLGTRLNPVRVLSVDKADDSLSPGATIDADGGFYDLTLRGNVVVNGLVFLLGDDFFTQDSDAWIRLEQCTINCDRWYINYLSTDVYREVFDCNITVASSIQVDYEGSSFRFRNTAFTFSVDGLFLATGIESADVLLEDCKADSNPILFKNASNFDGLQATLRRCSVHSSFDAFDGDLNPNNSYRPAWVLLENCNSGTITDPTLGIKWYEDYFGTAYHTTSVYRTGGADDGEQANAYALHMETNDNAKESILPLGIVLGSIWIDPDVSPTGATARSIHTSTRTMLQETAAALTTDGVSTWNGAGVGTKQKITHTLGNGDTLTVYVASAVTLESDECWIEVSEPDQVGGLVTVEVYLAKPSTVIYVDPLIEVV